MLGADGHCAHELVADVRGVLGASRSSSALGLHTDQRSAMRCATGTATARAITTARRAEGDDELLIFLLSLRR